MKSLICVVVPVGKAPYQHEIPNTLEAMQQLVGGLIEPVRLSNRLILICDEEAKINGKEGNRRIGSEIIAGQFFIVADGSDGDFASLDKYEVAAMLSRFATPENIPPEEVEDSIKMTFIEW